jgi:hypothetical protein
VLRNALLMWLVHWMGLASSPWRSPRCRRGRRSLTSACVGQGAGAGGRPPASRAGGLVCGLVAFVNSPPAAPAPSRERVGLSADGERPQKGPPRARSTRSDGGPERRGTTAANRPTRPREAPPAAGGPERRGTTAPNRPTPPITAADDPERPSHHPLALVIAAMHTRAAAAPALHAAGDRTAGLEGRLNHRTRGSVAEAQVSAASRWWRSRSGGWPRRTHSPSSRRVTAPSRTRSPIAVVTDGRWAPTRSASR